MERTAHILSKEMLEAREIAKEMALKKRIKDHELAEARRMANIQTSVQSGVREIEKKELRAADIPIKSHTTIKAWGRLETPERDLPKVEVRERYPGVKIEYEEIKEYKKRKEERAADSSKERAA